LNIIIESPSIQKQEKYIYESLIKIPFTTSLRIRDHIDQLIIKKENRTQILEINNVNDIEIQVQNKNQLLVHQVKEGDKNYLRFFVPNSIRENYQNNIVTITNKLTGQITEINVNYIENESESIFGIFLREYIVDFITVFIILLVIYILVIHNFSSQVRG